MTVARLLSCCTFLSFSQAVLVATAALTSSPCAAQAVAETDLVAPLAASSAQLRFHEGQVANNKTVIDPALPAVPGPVSSWTLSQWNHAVYLRPADLFTLRQPESTPSYLAVASDQETMLLVRHVATEPGFVFTLGNSNGTLTSGGGRAFYLSQDTTPGVNSNYDHEIDLSMDIRVVLASVSYTYPTAKASGAVLAMAYTGTGLMFTDPITHAQQFIFMQIGLTQSNSATVNTGFSCSGNTVVLYAPPVATSQQLPFKTDTGPLHHLTYNLTAAVKEMLSVPTPCGGTTSPWSSAMLDLANWRFTGTYIGSETENTDLRPGAATSNPQGSALLILDLANFSIRRD